MNPDEPMVAVPAPVLACAHDWHVWPIVLDFGRYGIHSRECKRCGEKQDSDPFEKTAEGRLIWREAQP